MKKETFTEIWKQELPAMMDLLEKFPHFATIPAPPELVQAIGDYKKHAFVIILDYGTLENKMRSPVGSSLLEVLMADPRAKQFAAKMQLIIKMDKSYMLHLSATRE